jgi:hypothetical protein
MRRLYQEDSGAFPMIASRWMADPAIPERPADGSSCGDEDAIVE